LPVVLTVGELIDELFPAQMDPQGIVANLKRRALESADVVIGVSQNTKQDLLKHYAIDEARSRPTR
jgi:hypothetical protein